MPIRMKKQHFILVALLCSTYLFLSAQSTNKTDKDTTTAALHQFDDVVIIGTLEKKGSHTRTDFKRRNSQKTQRIFCSRCREIFLGSTGKRLWWHRRS